ncbi:hypothetical protein DJ90_586 [Paenibacillus macerans]|uniref:Uncharacterized protein n=1 Tax=Paenibacillus macerans TaxID=44252 RepID=A0A090ZIS8_PAEMA|nr:hypothetical protein DJ90_586 [Paenibacillus macerans]
MFTPYLLFYFIPRFMYREVIYPAPILSLLISTRRILVDHDKPIHRKVRTIFAA